MKEEKKKPKTRQPIMGPCFRLDPEQRVCPQFDAVSIAKFPVAERDSMGFRVVDNCAEEHIE